jgi:cell division septal protein FtsQ
MSYRKKHLKSRMSKSRPKKSVLRRPIFWYSLLVLILIFTAIYFLIFYSKFQIKEIVISGNEKISLQNLQDRVSKKINKKFIDFAGYKISSNSIFLVNLQDIKNEIVKSYPVVKSVSAKKEYPNSLKFNIIERRKIAVFCQNGECFDIDDAGIIFEESNLAGNNLIVRQNLEAHINDIILGNAVVKENTIKSIEEIEKNLKENFQINLSEALISTPIRLDIKTGENWQIYFDISENSDIEPQITKLNLLLKDEINQEIRQKLEYIDLRFKDRAYYK